ncbi:hypothetical protein [Candidatus Laterigemmans baculatus]|nr:hypothetical protein [Candidatus Laterigemmans baculatus]
MSVQEANPIELNSDPIEQIFKGMAGIAELLDEIVDLSWPSKSSEEPLQDLLEMLQDTVAALAAVCGEGSMEHRQSLRELHDLLEPPHRTEGSTTPPESVASKWRRFSRCLTGCVKLVRGVAEHRETKADKHQQSSAPAGSFHGGSPVAKSELIYACDKALEARTNFLERNANL